MDLAALKAEFDEHGFLHLQGYFKMEEVDEWESKLDQFIAEVVPTLPRSQAMYEDYNDATTLKQINNLDESDAVFGELLHDPRLIQLTSALLEDEVVPVSAAAFIKAPLKGTPTPMHQDGYYFCLDPNEALTVWMPIGNIDASNGALCYIKGSHKNGIIPHGSSGVLGFSQGLSTDASSGGDEVVCAVEKGDLLVHHSRTIHYAAGNSSPRPRRSLGLVYYASRAQEDPTLKEHYDSSLQAQQAALGVK